MVRITVSIIQLTVLAMFDFILHSIQKPVWGTQSKRVEAPVAVGFEHLRGECPLPRKLFGEACFRRRERDEFFSAVKSATTTVEFVP